MDKKELAHKIYRISHIEGTFKLRSGQISNEYLDKYLFESSPELLREIVNQLSTLIPTETEILAGLEMGGIPIATALSMQNNIPAVFIRKKAKEYGTCKLTEGVDVRGKKVCIVEDVVTTGGQIILSANDLKGLGARVKYVLCVIEHDKKAGGNLKKEGLELIPLFTMEDITESKG